MKKKIILIILLVLAILIGICFGTGLFNKNKPEETNTEVTEPEVIDENKVIENIPTKEIFNATDVDENALEKEGFEEGPEFISSSKKDEEKFIVGAKQSSPVYYSQIDSRWRNHPYTITGNPNQTIGTSGCGPTSAAMIVTTIKGTIIPPDMGDLFIQHGFRTTNNGTYYSAFPWVANYFGIEMERVYSTYDMAAKVADGYIAVVACGEGLWTTGGHFITVMGNDNGTLMVYDPYLYNGKFDTASRRGAGVVVKGNAAYVTVQKFKDYSNAKAFWCYKYKDSSEPTPQPEPTPEPTPTPSTEKTMYVTANSGLNVRSGPGTNYKIVSGLSKGTKVIVYEEKSNWAKIGTDRWVCSDYLSDTKPGGTTPTPVPEPTEYKSWTGRVTAKSSLNIRKGPSTAYPIVGRYTYNTKITIIGDMGGWYKTNKGFVSAQYVSKTSGGSSSSSSSSSSTSKYVLGRYKTTVSSVLNVRSGPGTNYKVVRTYKNGTVFDTYQISGKWAKTPSGWVCLDYAKLLYKY